MEDGQDVHVVSWSPSQIVVELPLSGLGSAGNVQVAVRNHMSNVAQLTEWKGKFTFTIAGPGSLMAKTVYDVHLRDDIRKWRNQIHFPPR